MDNYDKLKELQQKINKIANAGIDQVIEMAFDRGRLTSDSSLVAKKEILEMVAPFKHKEDDKC
jgi:hypothetical protein